MGDRSHIFYTPTNTKLHIQWSTYKTTDFFYAVTVKKEIKKYLCCIFSLVLVFYVKALIANCKTL